MQQKQKSYLRKGINPTVPRTYAFCRLTFAHNSHFYLPLISTNWSTVNEAPLIGSVPFSFMYFSIRRRSKIAPLLGETTGFSGTSLQTKKNKSSQLLYSNLVKCKSIKHILAQISDMISELDKIQKFIGTKILTNSRFSLRQCSSSLSRTPNCIHSKVTSPALLYLKI